MLIVADIGLIELLEVFISRAVAVGAIALVAIDSNSLAMVSMINGHTVFQTGLQLMFKFSVIQKLQLITFLQ